MKTLLFKASDRGTADYGWLKSNYYFIGLFAYLTELANKSNCENKCNEEDIL